MSSRCFRHSKKKRMILFVSLIKSSESTIKNTRKTGWFWSQVKQIIDKVIHSKSIHSGGNIYSPSKEEFTGGSSNRPEESTQSNGSRG